MDPVGPSGEFIVDYSVYDAVRAGFDKVVFVICRDIEDEFKSTIGKRVAARVVTDYVFQDLLPLPRGFSVPAERRKPWGTGHAVLICAQAVDGPFAVINADDFYGRESYRALAGFLKETAADNSRCCMVGFILRNTLSEHGAVARGVCGAGPDGCLKSIVERTKIEKAGDAVRYALNDGQWRSLTGQELVSMNMWGFKPAIFGLLENEFAHFLATSGKDNAAEFFISEVVGRFVANGVVSVKILGTQSSWFGVTHPEDKAEAVARIQDLIKRGEYRKNLWE